MVRSISNNLTIQGHMYSILMKSSINLKPNMTNSLSTVHQLQEVGDKRKRDLNSLNFSKHSFKYTIICEFKVVLYYSSHV